MTLGETGVLPVSGERPPFAGYERLTGDSITRHVTDTDDVEELRVLLAFEQAQEARRGVLTATRARLGQQAQE